MLRASVGRASLAASVRSRHWRSPAGRDARSTKSAAISCLEGSPPSHHANIIYHD